VVGSSVGSLIGAFWASGYSASEIDGLSKQGGPLTDFDFSLFADRGWIRGQRLQDFVNDRLSSQRIELMPRKFIAAATRLNFEHARRSGEDAAYRLLPSLRAAMAAADVFP